MYFLKTSHTAFPSPEPKGISVRLKIIAWFIVAFADPDPVVFGPFWPDPNIWVRIRIWLQYEANKTGTFLIFLCAEKYIDEKLKIYVHYVKSNS
jgi:hypothetical protein